MSSEFLSVSYLEGINSFVVFSEVGDLLFKFLNSLIEASLYVHHLQFHRLNFIFVLALKGLLFLLKLSLVLVKTSLAFFLLGDVLLLEFTDFRFPRISLLCLFYGILLL